VRFLVEFGQIPATYGYEASYVFQGLTSDGKYSVSLTLPVNFPVLDVYNLPFSITDEASFEAFSNNLKSYQVGALAILNSAPDSKFYPDLGQLDALVQSLSVKQ
jgi:hypothetical protein